MMGLQRFKPNGNALITHPQGRLYLVEDVDAKLVLMETELEGHRVRGSRESVLEGQVSELQSELAATKSNLTAAADNFDSATEELDQVKRENIEMIATMNSAAESLLLYTT